MANLSYAYGTIEITADTVSCLETLKKVFKLTEETRFGTTCTNYSEICKNKKGYYTWCKFEGTGRGGYEDSIQFLFQFVEKKLSKEDVKILESSNFELVYNFVDYEPNCSDFFKATDAMCHKAGRSIWGYDMYVAGDEELLDLSWGSRLKHRVESLESLKEMLLDMDDEGVYDFLQEEKVSLEGYFHKPLNKLLNTCLSEVKEAYLKGKKKNKEWQKIIGRVL